MQSFVEFSVWNINEERPATKEEIGLHIRVIVRNDNGNCEIEVDDGFSLLSE